MSYDDYNHYRPAYNPPTPKPKRHIAAWIAGGLLTLCVGGTVVNAVAGRSDGKTPGPIASKARDVAERAISAAPTGSPTKARPPAKPATVGAGSWQVGIEVKPGTYTTTAQDHCYWARLKAFDGDFDSIIVNGNLGAGEHGRLTVKKTDKGIELTGDCTWTRAS